MPEINVKLFANFREFAKTKELRINSGTPREAILTLCKKYPGLENMIFKEGKLRPYVNVFLNGKNITGLDVPLKKDDELAFFPPVSGG